MPAAITQCHRTSRLCKKALVRLSCIQSGLPTGRLDVNQDRDRPSHTSDRGQENGTCHAGSGASIDD